MVATTVSHSPILTPEEVGDLLVVPTFEESVAGQVAERTTTASKTFRIPRVDEDPTAAWVDEGAEITPSDATVDEVNVTPTKIAGLSIITRELADDSSPEAAAIVGAGLARDIARRLDEAFFGGLSSPAQAGLASLEGVSLVISGPPTDGDPFVSAVYAAESHGATLTSFVAHPTDALALAVLKEATGSNRALLQPDPTQPTRRLLAGVPMFVSPSVEVGTIWGIPRDRALLVVRDDAEVVADRSVFFTSDRIAVRATMRCGFGFAHEASIVKIDISEQP